MFEEYSKFLKCNMKEYLLVREIVKKMDGGKRKCDRYVYHLEV